jgi:glycosyltransferase involved in cell wall biosynthesis
MSKLSIIIPYIQEYPQILFTIRSIHEELKNEVDHEIIAIDNLNNDARKQIVSKNIKIDKGHLHTNNKGEEAQSHIKNMADQLKNKWLKYIHYTDYFSLWQSRNCGIKNATGDIIMFIDAHCVPSKKSLVNMFNYYEKNWEELDGSIHLPLTYHILEEKKLIYKFLYDKSKGQCQYSFTSLNKYDDVFETPCMSTCGMMCHKSFYDKTGLYPQKGIYSGGEHFFNYVMAILGKKKWIYSKNESALFHHGDQRDYNYTWDGYQYNRIAANYMFGGEEWVDLYIKSLKINEDAKINLKKQVVEDIDNIKQREMIVSNQKITIEEWAEIYSPK